MKTIVIEATPCPSCGMPMPAGALAGLCPACLLAQGAETDAGDANKGGRFVPPPLEEIAKLFPQLEILGLLGAGGMGAVYKARQPALDRIVALKILPSHSAEGANFEERFNREARALARLSHPNIVAVFEFGQVGGKGGLHFFIMEFVDGANLRQLEQAGRLAPREALQIIPQICDALQYAHDEGVVHRDIKPENVLVDRKGRVKIADFGLAKIMGHDPESLRLTAEGQVMGTPHYMAPEQIEKPLTVDHRADIYSLGVVLYEMLTGDLPLGKFAPPSRKYQLDVRLDDVVLRALENDPARRYQHASEVKTQVENIVGTPEPKAPAASIPEPRTVRWASFPILIERHGARRVVWQEALRAWAIVFGYLSLAFMLVSGLTGRTPFGWLGLQGWPSVLMRAILAASMVAWGVRLAWRWPWDETRTPQGTVMLPGNPWWRRPRWALLLVFLVGLTGAVFQRKSLQSSLADLLKAAPATSLKVAVNDSKTGTFIAKLPVRGTVELLAVSDAGSESNGWWRPNGTPVPDAHYDHADAGRLDFNGWAEKDLVLRWRDLPTGAEGPYLEFEPAGAFSSGGKSWRDAKSFFGTRPVRAAFPPTATEATMRVGFDLTAWRTVSTHDRNGNGNVLKTPPGVPNVQAQVHGVSDNKGQARVTMLLAKENREWKVRVIAVDTNGVEHPQHLGTSTPADKTSVFTYEFMGLPLARVKEFRVQVRPVHWIEFRDVALQGKGLVKRAALPQHSVPPSEPTKTIVLTRATNQIVGEAGVTQTVGVWSDNDLQPGETFRTVVQTQEGEKQSAAPQMFVRCKQGTVHTSTAFTWSFQGAFGEHEAQAAVAQMQANQTERPLTLTSHQPLEMFSITNRFGGVMVGYVEFVRTDPLPVKIVDGAAVKVRAMVRIKRFRYFPTMDYSAEVPPGYALRMTASDGEVSTHTWAEPREYSSTWFQPIRSTRSVGQVQRPSQQASFQAQLQALQEQGPLEIVLGEPRLLFSITNSPGDVIHSYLELVGPNPDVIR